MFIPLANNVIISYYLKKSRKAAGTTKSIVSQLSLIRKLQKAMVSLHFNL